MSADGQAVPSYRTEFTQCSGQSHCSFPSSTKRPVFKRTNSDFFIVTKEITKESTAHQSTEKKREQFSSRRSKSFKELFFHSKQDKQRKAKTETKSKFADIVSKHLLPLHFVTSLKSRGRPNSPGLAVCPNSDDFGNSLCSRDEKCNSVTKSQKSSKLSPVKAKHSIPIEEYHRIPIRTSNSPVRIQHLALPPSPNALTERSFAAVDIFTTSFTRSTSPKRKGVQILERGVCKSAQELPKSPFLTDKPKLTRSYSDIPASNSLKGYPQIATCLQSKMFKNEFVSQILDYLFIGSIETAYNEPQLCRLKIDSLVDMSNLSVSQVPSSKKLHCPCLCSNVERHFRSRLIIKIDDDKNEDIEQYFSEINKFIDGARRCGKKVLIFSYQGKSRAPTAAIQYLMTNENFLLRQAFNLIKNQRPEIEVNAGFQDTLERVERNLFPEAKPSVSFSSDYLNIADPQAIKCAWVDCADMRNNSLFSGN